MAIATADELKLQLKLEHAEDNNWIDLCLAAAQQAIEFHCRRTFDVPAAGADATSRTYYPQDGDCLEIDDLASTTGVVVSDYGSTVSAANIQWEPLNQLGDDRRYRPYSRIQLLNGYCWSRYEDQATVTITSAKWGWTSVPDLVKRATLELAKDFVQYREMRFGIGGFGEYGAIRIRSNPVVSMMLAGFVRYDRLGIA